MLDVELVKLQYEILNISLDTLANELAIPLSILQSEATRNNWQPWWPEETPLKLISKEDDDIEEDPAETLALQSEQFLDSARRRLAVYSLAKEIHLARKYLNLEALLLSKTCETLEELNTQNPLSSTVVKTLSDIYKNLIAKSPMNALQTITLSEDEGGLPMVTIRDLSGGARTNGSV